MNRLLAYLTLMGGIGMPNGYSKQKGPTFPQTSRTAMIAEYKLIKAKQSKLSASQRAEIVWWVERNCKPEELI